VPSPRVTSYTANALNQYTQVAGVAFTYDANGNLTNDGKQTYRYDAQNRLLVVESVAPTTGANRAEFAYDARNRAVARTYYTLNKAGTWVLDQDDSHALTYDTAWNLLAERTRNGAQVGEYIHGQRTDEVLVSNLKSQQVYPLADGLGSVVALANDNGKIIERFRYSAYGQPTNLSATYQPGASSVSSYRLLFTGREWLGAIGLNEHRNRYYSASLARWLSPDPIQFSGGSNLYAYVKNDPQYLTDQLGLAPCGPADWAECRSRAAAKGDNWSVAGCNVFTIRILGFCIRTINCEYNEAVGDCYYSCPTKGLQRITVPAGGVCPPAIEIVRSFDPAYQVSTETCTVL
jgi:RHS repeat-associated protein